jgi:CBS domain-containing protein
MFSEPIKNVMEHNKVVSAPPDLSVEAAARLMAERQVGAVLVVEQKRLVGIFTERDAVFRVVAKGRDPRATRLAEVMTKEPKTVSPKESFGYAMLVMHENGFRHMPVLENGEPVGVVSARNALDPELEEFESEAQRRKSIRRQAEGL